MLCLSGYKPDETAQDPCKGGANGALAAKHARTIIDQLVGTGICNPKLMGRLTRHGDARIKDCIKFDLVRGYRLVSIVKDQEIAILYVGSHDECDRWIKNNAGLDPVLDKKRNKLCVVEEAGRRGRRNWKRLREEPDYAEELLRNITDQELREIFRGLCKQ